VNKFADWTPFEYKSILGYKKNPHVQVGDGNVKILPTDALQESVDWVAGGA
jgi:hypothetical protein